MHETLVALANGAVGRRSVNGDCRVELTDVADLSIGDVLHTFERDATVAPSVTVMVDEEDVVGDSLGQRLRGIADFSDLTHMLIFERDGDLVILDTVLLLPAIRDPEEASRRVRAACLLTPLHATKVEYGTDDGFECYQMLFETDPNASLREINRAWRTVVTQLTVDVPSITDPLATYRHLASGDWAALRHLAETPWLEVKQKFYGIKDPDQRHEFALDVSSLANNREGGILIVGFDNGRHRWT